MSRRAALRTGLFGAGALAAGGLLSGCGPADAAEVPLQFWSPLTGGDGALMHRMIADVHKAAPELAVDSTALAWGRPYYTKLAMSSVGGRSPDVAVMHLSRLGGYAPAGLLHPFDLDLLAEYGAGEDDFIPRLWKSAQHEGTQFAIPFDTHPFVMFYNIPLAEEAGLLDGDGRLKPLDSAEAFVAASHRMSEVTGDTGTAYGHVNDPAQAWRFFGGLYGQTGRRLDLSGDRHDLDHDAALRVFEFVAEVFDGEHSPGTLNYAAALGTFTDGRAGFFISGEWELPGLVEALGEDLGALAMPTFFDEPASYADSHSFVLPARDTTDPERFRAAHQFAALILKNSLTWAEAGHIPAYQPVVESAAYADMQPQAGYRSAGEKPVLDPRAWFTGAGSQFHDQMSVTMTVNLIGDGPEAAVESMDSRLTGLLAKENPIKGGAR
ncbi:extracellular solute-binding protein [Murinocardiopsis flavida]|nr:extracellular solute-binding protein [Murinocardiopsis flavida]